MKKIICLLLALVCLFAVVSCDDNSGDQTGEQQGDQNGGQDGGSDKETKSISEVIAMSKPTVVTTHIAYNGDDVLEGEFITRTDGAISVFEYNYQRLATVPEMSDGRIKTVEGKIYYKDGQVYTTEGEAWVDVDTYVTSPFTVRIEEDKFKTYELSEDGKTLEGTIVAENSERVLGTAINADGDISIEIITNGYSYLYYINVSYKAAGSGALVTINTSYDYSSVELEVPGEE